MSGLSNMLGNAIKAKQAGGRGAVYTGVRHRENPADRSRARRGGPGDNIPEDERRPRARPPIRRNRMLGGDVRTPLSQ